MVTRPRIAFAFLLAALLLLVAAGAPNHPSPATADSVPVGDGTKWNSVTYPTLAGPYQVNFYNTSSNVFGQRSATWLWTNYCPASAACNDNSTPFLGAAVQTYDGFPDYRDVRCSAITEGTGTGDVNVYVYAVDSSGIICTVTMPCVDFNRRGDAIDDCGVAGSSSKDVVLYWDPSACDTAPDNVMCTVLIGDEGT